jgi:RNA polymerase sigma-70 factor (ECF subfamily)
MGFAVPPGSMETDDLVAKAAAGDSAAMGALFSRYRERLKTMVRLRLDRRLQGRVDASDVLQEAFIEAAQRLPEYARTPPAQKMPLFLWLRFLTGQRMLIVHRRHLGAKMRSAKEEVSLYRRAMPEATTLSLAAQLLGRLTSPTQAAVRAELQLQLQQALNGMDATDREVLILRHFEELNNNETAVVLGISKTAASNRYVRALRRLKRILSGIAEFREYTIGAGSKETPGRERQSPKVSS